MELFKDNTYAHFPIIYSVESETKNQSLKKYHATVPLKSSPAFLQ